MKNTSFYIYRGDKNHNPGSKVLPASLSHDDYEAEWYYDYDEDEEYWEYEENIYILESEGMDWYCNNYDAYQRECAINDILGDDGYNSTVYVI